MMFLQRLWYQFGHLEQMHLVSAILLFNYKLLDFCSKLLDFCFFFTLLFLTILFSAELEGFVCEHSLLFLLSLFLLSSNISSFTVLKCFSLIQSTQWTLCLQFEFHRGASSPRVYCEARIEIQTWSPFSCYNFNSTFDLSFWTFSLFCKNYCFFFHTLITVSLKLQNWNRMQQQVDTLSIDNAKLMPDLTVAPSFWEDRALGILRTNMVSKFSRRRVLVAAPSSPIFLFREQKITKLIGLWKNILRKLKMSMQIQFRFISEAN